MIRALTIMYDKTGEDIAVMCVAERDMLSNTSMRIFTGEKAERLFKELTEQNVTAKIRNED